MEPTPSPKSSMAVPIAIVVGFTMIAIAIFFTGGKTEQAAPVAQQQASSDDSVVTTGTVRPVSENDYIRGNPNAPIIMVEYSDYDCPFCKQYHDTMKQVIEEFGIDGQVAWVYRQFPLGQLHPNSPKISEAALCVGDLGGNEAFWKFTDMVFEQRDVNVPTNITKLGDYAVRAGINADTFKECTESERMKAAVEASAKDAFDIGARGTPYTILIAGNQQAVISGAQSYVTVRGIVSNLIGQLNGTIDPATATGTVSTQ